QTYLKRMSLMKLLSVSKSFADGTNQPGRYKMAEQGLLPKFAPMGRTVSLAPQRKSDEAAETQELSARVATPARVAHAESPEPGIAPLKASAPKTPALACADAHAAPTKWFRLGNKPTANRPAGRPRPLNMAQAERSLDAVRPVRNDLSDSDLQIVPAKRETEPEALKANPPRWLRPELTGLAWSRLTSRLFNSERVRA